MSEIRSYRDMDVWKRGRVLVKRIYELTASFPKEELYGITNQLRRASVSIPSNIAEGHSRGGTKDYIHFISMAIGSLAEVETQLLLAEDLTYVVSSDTKTVFEDIVLLQKKLHSLRTALRNRLHSPMPNAQRPIPESIDG